MTTNPDLEFRGVSLIYNPTSPTDYNEGKKKDERRLHRIEAKELREFNQPMVEFNYHKELTDTLWNPRNNIMKQLNEWNYSTISEDEALHTPYKHAA